MSKFCKDVLFFACLSTRRRLIRFTAIVAASEKKMKKTATKKCREKQIIERSKEKNERPETFHQTCKIKQADKLPFVFSRALWPDRFCSQLRTHKCAHFTWQPNCCKYLFALSLSLCHFLDSFIKTDGPSGR